jgi:hypothetical protein
MMKERTGEKKRRSVFGSKRSER